MMTRLAPLVLLCLSLSCSDDTVKPDVNVRPPDAAFGDRVVDDLPHGDAITLVTIGPAGGQAKSVDGALQLDIPAGALSKQTKITITKTSNVPSGSVGLVGYDIGPTGMVFEQEVTLTISYNPADLGGMAESSLKIAVAEGGAWQPLASSVPDPALDKVSATLAHLSVYGIVGEVKGCGDGQKGSTEECDGKDLGGKSCATQGFEAGTLACKTDCTLDTAGCTKCGDAKIGGAEACDGTDLGGKSCATQGFDGGTLACKTDCTLDTSGCFKCGDAKIGGSEACDGTDLGGKSCATQGFDGGTLACTGSCTLDTSACTKCGDGKLGGSEACDGGAFGGKSCATQGFDGGTLACTAGCALETSGCYKCGDGLAAGPEACDIGDLRGKTCATEGFDAGALSCTTSCALDTSGCRKCGDGKLSPGEVCDGPLFGGATCASLGFDGGTLYCLGNCTFDTGACRKCGDGKLSPGEACDGSLHGGTTCQTLGYEAGSLLCSSNCTFDTGFCFNYPPIAITPGSTSVAPRGSLSFSASGGTGTYTFSLTASPSGGSITSGGSYQAGATGNVTDTVHVVDPMGHHADATVTVGPGVSIAPATVTTSWPGTINFAASGGSGTGYTYALTANLSGGSITPAGAYLAGTTGPATDTVEVTDSLGNTATATINVLAPLSSSPVTAMVAPLGQQQLTGGGGSGSYTWSMGTSASGGTVGSSGLYTAGNGGIGTDIVKMTDSSTGVTLNVAVVVASTFINQSFASTTIPGWTKGGSAQLTVGGYDIDGEGWLRLTTNGNNQVGWAYFNQAFNLSRPIRIELDFAAWAGSGADGIAVALFDAAASFSPGADGDSIGYVGMSGAYTGVGVYEYQWPRWKVTPPDPTDMPNTVGIMGSAASSYPNLAHTQSLSPFWFAPQARPAQTGSAYRRLRVDISAAPNPVATVSITFGAGAQPTQVLSSVALPAVATTQLLRLSLTASTGTLNAVHEVKNLVVTAY